MLSVADSRSSMVGFGFRLTVVSFFLLVVGCRSSCHLFLAFGSQLSSVRFLFAIAVGMLFCCLSVILSVASIRT
jgi:hypothetical protein